MIEDILRELDSKKDRLSALQPILPDFKRRLEAKYRLEWNFHSNHIEGNTLTYGQTKILLFKGRATGEHEKREYDEMEAHDLAIDLIRDWAKDNRRIMTEADLRELNKIILVKPFWSNAITLDGNTTRKQIVPGTYKTSPNSVLLKNGQMHHYPSPEETPALMSDLFKWYKNSSDFHPLLQGAYAHHKLTQIHPFDDGNGRVARLWLNYILLRNQFPPVIIRTENKEQYLTALEKADAGDIDSFVKYLAKELEWSLELSFKAAKSLDLEESDDLDKHIAILDKKIKNGAKDSEAAIERKPELLFKLIKRSLLPLSEIIDNDLNKVKDWFNNVSISFILNNNPYATSFDVEWDTLINRLPNEAQKNVRLQVLLEGFKNLGPDAFTVSSNVSIELKKWSYEFILNNRDTLIKKTYTEFPTNEELKVVSKTILSEVVNEVEETIRKQKGE